MFYLEEPELVLTLLVSQDPVMLSQLPNSHGVYGLIDHSGDIRYFGVTASMNEGFRTRIYSKHVTGSEGRSHKFSQAYNVGRMWRSRLPLPIQKGEDSKLAKKVRTHFCRRFCRAVYHPIPKSSSEGDYFRELELLESAIQELAPETMRAWEGKYFPPVVEPRYLVDSVIDELGLTTSEIESLDRQAALFGTAIS